MHSPTRARVGLAALYAASIGWYTAMINVTGGLIRCGRRRDVMGQVVYAGGVGS